MIDVKAVHELKAELPILATEFGIIIDVKPIQLRKAESLILVTG